MASSALAAHASVAPVALRWASRFADAPFAVRKLPPTYTVEFVATMARTSPPMLAANDVLSAPVAVSKAATLRWDLPSTVVKSPPT